MLLEIPILSITDTKSTPLLTALQTDEHRMHEANVEK